MFLIAKSNPDKWRDILNLAAEVDLSSFNLPNKSYNDSTPLEQRPSVQPGSISQILETLSYLQMQGIDHNQLQLATLDISEAYKHVKVKESKQRQLMFRFRGKTYVTMVLPFGSAAAASIYIRFMNLFQAFWGKHGIISITYIDDIYGRSCRYSDKDRNHQTIRTTLFEYKKAYFRKNIVNYNKFKKREIGLNEIPHYPIQTLNGEPNREGPGRTEPMLRSPTTNILAETSDKFVAILNIVKQQDARIEELERKLLSR